MLIDQFGRVHRYLRLSVTDRCNLRCFYCYPNGSEYQWKPREEILTYEEIQQLVEIFAHLGIEKIRITGGEPLLRHNLAILVNRLASIKGITHIGLTTNGILLARFVEELKEAGVNSINISLDTLRPDRYQRITGFPLYYQVKEGIDKALMLGFNSVKINCVVIRGFNEDEIDDFMNWIQEAPIEVRFIEFMPFQGTSWEEGRVVTGFEIESYLR
ncbi:MAG: GTP 3',8-cyclase MoaA, partial [bacterium]